MTTESKPSFSKAKQTFLDLTSLADRTVFGLWRTKNVESKRQTQTFPLLSSSTELIVNVADLQSFTALVKLCIEFGQQHQGSKYKALNQWSWFLDAACEDTAVLVQLIMDRQETDLAKLLRPKRLQGLQGFDMPPSQHGSAQAGQQGGQRLLRVHRSLGPADTATVAATGRPGGRVSTAGQRQ